MPCNLFRYSIADASPTTLSEYYPCIRKFTKADLQHLALTIQKACHFCDRQGAMSQEKLNNLD